MKVSQALEENFTELEKIKSDKDKTQVNGEKAKADDADMAKTNGKAEVNGKADTNGKAETNGKSANGKKTGNPAVPAFLSQTLLNLLITNIPNSFIL